MAGERLLLIGTQEPGLVAALREGGYSVRRVDTLDKNGGQPWADVSLVLVDEEVLAETMERLRKNGYSRDDGTVVVCTRNAPTLDEPLRRDIECGHVACLSYHEVESGTAAGHVSSILRLGRLRTRTEELQRRLREMSDLRRRLSLREKVVDHERKLNANLIASITSGLVIIDLSGTIILVNEQAGEMVGSGTVDAAGLDYHRLLPEPIAAPVETFLGEQGSNPPRSTTDKIRLGPRYLQVTQYRILDSTGACTGLLVFLHDVTREETAAQELFRAEKLATIGTMVAGISHELRNPLAIISARIQRVLEREDGNDPWLRKHLESIESQALRCGKVVEGLLDFSGQTSAAPSLHELEGLLDEALGYARYRNVFDNITVEKRCEPGLNVYGDRTRLVQAFLNVIANAGDSLGGKGTLALSTSRRDRDVVVVEIQDDGPGIAEENLERIFDPFYTTKDPGTGTGLGLAIAHKIVAHSRGKIEVSSEAGCTRFTLSLPARKATAS